jgi:hypothetical protein
MSQNIHKDILALQKDINNLEIFHLREEFGEYYGQCWHLLELEYLSNWNWNI